MSCGCGFGLALWVTAAIVASNAIAPAAFAQGAGEGAEAVLVAAVTSSKPPDLIDDFSNAKSGWTVIDQGVRHQGYRNGTYHIALDGPGEGWVMGSNNQRLSNAILQLDVAEAPGSIGHPYGVFVREQDDEDFYGFVFSSDMSFAAFHVKDGALAIDGPANAFLPKGLLRTDGPNRVQVFMQDATLVYFLNGREIARANAIWSMGTAGALSATGQPGKTDVVFDDWKVWIASVTGGASGPSSPPRSGANDIDTRSNPAALGGGF